MQERMSDKTAGLTNRRDSHNIQMQKKTEDSNLPERGYDPLEDINCRIGDNTCATNHVNVIQRKSLFHSMNESQKVTSMHRLQRQYGNRFVQRVIARNAIQTKLRIGKPGDIYEKEADRVADQVMRMPEPRVQRQEEGEEEEEEETEIQAKPLAGQITPLVQRQYDEELEEEEPDTEEQLPEEEREETLPAQAKRVDGKIPQPSPGLEAHIRQIKGGGQPLPKSVRTFFEPRFGYDFSQVRVHIDTEADTFSRSLNAYAFTTGQDIFFRQGTYNPGGSGGRKLLAHELTHVVQQSNARVRYRFSDRGASNASTMRTNRIMDRITIRSIYIQRQQPNCKGWTLARVHYTVLRTPGSGVWIMSVPGWLPLERRARLIFKNGDSQKHTIEMRPTGFFTRNSFQLPKGGIVAIRVGTPSKKRKWLSCAIILDPGTHSQGVYRIYVCR
jgi:hypothetical protein